MEVISGLVLILLSFAGARNIPTHMDQHSELPLVFDVLPSYTKSPPATIIPTGELVESLVDVEDLGLHLNKNAEEDKKIEDHLYSTVDVETNINVMNNGKVRKNNQKEQLDSVLRPAEATEAQNNKKTKELLLEHRAAFGTPCPPGKQHGPTGCWAVVPPKPKKVRVTSS